MTHKDVIKKLVGTYNSAQPSQYRITRWPDEEERDQRACDAWAEAPGAVPLAIEHTKIETFTDRKLDDARFMKVVGPLETEFKNKFPYGLSLWVPTFAVQPGTNWEVIATKLRAWLSNNADSMPEGRSKHSIPNLPFQVSIDKQSDAPNLFTVGRTTPANLDEKAELVRKWCTALVNKDDQLKRYHLLGAQTFLLAESDDIALVSPVKLYKAFLCAQSKVSIPNIDEVWLAHTYHPENMCNLECFCGPKEIMERTNPPNFMLGPQYGAYWQRALKEEGWY